MGATSLYISPFAAPLTPVRPGGASAWVAVEEGGRGSEQAEEEGCRSELERTKRSFVGALYTAELY